MDVILLERIAKLGQMGDIVSVKSGFARNFLLPQGKALRANDASKALFENQRVELEARNLERKSEAEKVKEKLDGNAYMVIRSAGQTGQLYGSVSPRDIAATLEENGFSVARNQVTLLTPIKVIGLHELQIVLHPEVNASITMNVARSKDEAERQSAGEDLTGRVEIEDYKEEEESPDLSEVFDNPDDVELDEGDAEEADEAAEKTSTETSTDEENTGEETDEKSDKE